MRRRRQLEQAGDQLFEPARRCLRVGATARGEPEPRAEALVEQGAGLGGVLVAKGLGEHRAAQRLGLGLVEHHGLGRQPRGEGIALQQREREAVDGHASWV